MRRVPPEAGLGDKICTILDHTSRRSCFLLRRFTLARGTLFILRRLRSSVYYDNNVNKTNDDKENDSNNTVTTATATTNDSDNNIVCAILREYYNHSYILLCYIT